MNYFHCIKQKMLHFTSDTLWGEMGLFVGIFFLAMPCQINAALHFVSIIHHSCWTSVLVLFMLFVKLCTQRTSHSRPSQFTQSMSCIWVLPLSHSKIFWEYEVSDVTALETGNKYMVLRSIKKVEEQIKKTG